MNLTAQINSIPVPYQVDTNNFAALVQNYPDAIFIVQDTVVSYANRAALDLLKLSAQEQLLGLHFDQLFQAVNQGMVQELMRGVRNSGQDQSLKHAQLMCADHSRMEVELQVSKLSDTPHARLQVILRSPTYQHAAEVSTRLVRNKFRSETERNKEALHHEKEILEMIALDKPLTHILQDVCDRMEGLLGNAAACCIMLLDADRKHLSLGAAPSLPDEFCALIDNASVSPHSGLCGAAIYHGRAVIIEDLANNNIWKHAGGLAQRHHLRSGWAMPIATAFNTVLGAFSIYYPVTRCPSEDEQALIQDACHLIGLAIDKKNMERSLEESEERYRSVVTNLTEGIMVVAPGGTILTINPSAERILKIKNLPLIGRRHRYFTRLLSADGTPIALGDDPASVVFRSKKAIVNLSLGVELRDQSVVWLVVNVLPIVSRDGNKIVSVLISFTDTTEVRETQRQLVFMASHDVLTGLPNRHQLNGRLSQALAQAKRLNQKVAVLFLDLDRFKNVNDTAGHAAGDDLLKNVAARLSECIRASDMLARLGGDEFVILAEGFTDASQLKELAERVLSKISLPFRIEGNEYHLGTSIGISVYPHDGEDVSTLLRCADSAMYHAKECGRNNYQFFTTELNVRAQHRYALETNLRHAMANQEFLLHFQPKVCLRSGRIVGAEALIRWEMPYVGIIPPSEFIPISEEIGLIFNIGRWVLEQTCKQTQYWREHGAPELVVSVNISPRQFQDPKLVNMIEAALRDSGLPGSALQLEITEGLLMGEVESLLPMMRAIKDLGISISLDDFGTGFSSLSYLQRFPIDNLKIDRSFIKDIPDNPDSIALTHTIIAMAKTLGMTVTAEGVETEAQANFLKASECQEVQGYYYSRPVAPAEFQNLLQQHVLQPLAQR